MRMPVKVLSIGGLCLALAGLGSVLLTDPNSLHELVAFGRRIADVYTGRQAGSTGQPLASAMPAATTSRTSGLSYPLFSAGGFETGGFGTANHFTGAIGDRGSIEEVCKAIGARARRGIDTCLDQLRSLQSDDPRGMLRRVRIEGILILLLMYEGRFDEAAQWTERTIVDAANVDGPPGLTANLRALLGVIHLRRGETENCVDCIGPSSCIFPIGPQAVHLKTSGSREAIRNFTEYLRERPDDQGVRWLANVAFMTLGEYPDNVPRDLVIPLDAFRSKLDVGRFENVASAVGLGVRGPNMAGGSVFDDFTGDDLPDIFITSSDVDLGASLFVNLGDGTFEDRSARAGLRHSVIPSTAHRPISTTTGGSMSCWCAEAGKTPPRSRSCGTMGMVNSRT